MRRKLIPIVLAALIAVPGVALAHASLISSMPAANSTVEAPARIVLRFNERLIGSAARYFLLASASLAIATLVWTGHAGATEGWAGTAHRLSDMVHMLASAVWIGGIAAFAWMLFRPAMAQSGAHLAVAHRALDRFSRVGTIAVAVIIATGIINCLAVEQDHGESPFKTSRSGCGRWCRTGRDRRGAAASSVPAARWRAWRAGRGA